MYHSITFGTVGTGTVGTYNSVPGVVTGKNTWDDWGLIPTVRPVVAPPSIKSQVIDLPGGNGYIDLTELLTGEIAYGSRQGSWSFVSEPQNAEIFPWQSKYTAIMEYLHGKEYKVWLEDDPAFYYEGRLTVAGWQPGANWSQVAINYVLKPFKKERLRSYDDWLWDPFSFVDGIIRCYNGITLGNSGTTYTLVIDVGQERLSPVIVLHGTTETSTNPCQVEFGGTNYELTFGNNSVNEITLKGSGNTLKFKPRVSGLNVTIKFRGGWL